MAKGVISYGLVPSLQASGTATFYQSWAASLRSKGWQVVSVGVGQEAAQRYDPQWGDEHSFILAPQETDLTKQVQAFLDWVNHSQVDIVIPTGEFNIMAALPHLPPRVRYITICHSVIRSAYIFSSLYPERLSHAVAINQVQMATLHRRWKVPQEKLVLIPHGIALEKFSEILPSDRNYDSLQLLFIGTISHDIKGVLWLPRIIENLSDRHISSFLHVVGAGPDLAKLKSAVVARGLDSQVRFYGTQPPEEIPRLLSRADILLMPSRFEGFPLVCS